MNQTIRSKVFETNSSSCHAIVIEKDKNRFESRKVITEYEFNIPLLQTVPNCNIRGPEDMLSYLYTLSVVSHNWKLYDAIKATYNKCIFQKPLYYIDHLDEYQYCDDREIISFCDTNVDFKNYFTDNEINKIIENLTEIVSFGFVYINYDLGYRSYLEDELKNGLYKNVDEYIAYHIKLIIGK